MSTGNAFSEVQRLKGWITWLISLLAFGSMSYMVYKQVLLGHPVGTKPAPDWVVILMFIFSGVIVPVFLFVTNLTVKVEKGAIFYRLFPLQLQFNEIAVSTIEEIEATTYKPIREYGGWGIRIGTSGKAYSMSGNRGVRIKTAFGDRILFGSSKPEELYKAIESQMVKQELNGDDLG